MKRKRQKGERHGVNAISPKAQTMAGREAYGNSGIQEQLAYLDTEEHMDVA